MYILFRRYDHLDDATTPLSEGVTPNGQALSKTDIRSQIKQYGDYVQITDKVDLTARDPVLTEAAELLGEQMGRTRDKLVRNAILHDYYDNRATYANAVAASTSGDKFSQTHVMDAVDKLLGENARFLTNVIRPSTGYNTMPIRQAYVAICHTDMREAIEDMSDFVPISEYPSNETIMDGEWGAVKNVRFILSTIADKGDICTNGNYVIPVFGADAYGVTELAGGAASNIVKAMGSAGTADPLDQRTTSGWKMWMTASVLNDKFMALIHDVGKE